MRGSMGGGWIAFGRVLVVTLTLLAVGGATPAAAEPLVIDFESVTPRDPALADYWDPNPGFTVAGTFFSGGSYAGFVVSSSTTTGVAGYLGFFGEGTAEISAQSNAGAGGGVDGSTNFAVAYNGGSSIDLPVGYRPSSVDLTNTATVYEAILNGLFQASAFAAGDWFRVTFTGYSATGGTGSQTGVPVDFYLADYRAGQALIVDSWTPLDLSPLGDARSMVLSFASTDNNPNLPPIFAMNTPAYVAIDNLALMAVPEPGAAALAAAGVVWCLLQRGRRRAGRVNFHARSRTSVR